jgi:hypothetical protein
MDAIDVDESSVIMGEPKVKIISLIYGEYFSKDSQFPRVDTVSFTYPFFLFPLLQIYNTNESVILHI